MVVCNCCGTNDIKLYQYDEDTILCVPCMSKRVKSRMYEDRNDSTEQEIAAEYILDSFDELDKFLESYYKNHEVERTV